MRLNSKTLFLLLVVMKYITYQYLDNNSQIESKLNYNFQSFRLIFVHYCTFF
jgi:hypothetical protein